MHKIYEHKYTIWLTLLLSIFFSLMLSSRPLTTPDEGRYSEIPREMLATGDFITPHLNSIKYLEKPPLFYWMQATSYKLFGLNSTSVHLATLLLALVGCLTVYFAGTALFDRRSGILATVILATSTLYYICAHTIALDLPVTIFLSIGLLSFLVGLKHPVGSTRRTLMWILYITSALTVLTKGLIGIIFPGFIIFCYLLITKRWQLLKSVYLYSGTLIFLMITLPWHILVQLKNPEFLHFYLLDQQFLRFSTDIAGRTHSVFFFIPVLLIGFFPWTLFLPQTIHTTLSNLRNNHNGSHDELFLLIWTITIFIFFSCSNSKLIPYILPMFPPLSLLVSRYLSSHWQSKNLKGIRLPFKLIGYIGLVMSILIYLSTFSPGMELNSLTAEKYIIALGLLLTMGGFVTTWLYYKKNLLIGLVSLSTSTIIVLITLNAGSVYLDTRSVKPLADQLKPQLSNQDDVITYGKYFQDLPVYLKRRITVANWINEFDFGMKHQDTHDWMINEQEFWRRVSSPHKKVFVLTTDRFREKLLWHKPEKLYLLGKTNDQYLLSNQPPQLTIQQG